MPKVGAIGFLPRRADMSSDTAEGSVHASTGLKVRGLQFEVRVRGARLEGLYRVVDSALI